ncbi:MAG: endolytic transglycosylase MltG [Polyangiaceae bacterium]
MSDPEAPDDETGEKAAPPEGAATPDDRPGADTDQRRRKRHRRPRTAGQKGAPSPQKKPRKPRKPGASKRPRKPKKRPSTVAATRHPRRVFSRKAESRRQILFAAGGVLAVIATATILLVFGYARIGGPGSTAVEVVWPAGLDPEQSAALLADAGLVHSASAMALYLRASGGTADFVPGEHLLYHGASPHEIRDMLSRSPTRTSVRVVIPEGFHRFDVADRLQKLHIVGQRQFLTATTDRAFLVELGIDTTGKPSSASVPNQERTTEAPESAEGYLFPATYDFQIDTEAREVVRRLVAESDRRWAELVSSRGQGLSTLTATLGWGRREVVTMASIIQREAMVDEERPVIASVFFNRLLDPNFKPRRRLQSDPTAMYGCVAHPEEAPTCADYKGKPTSAILHDPKNRYTTYMAPGLPPGPISNPGVASLSAVLSPAATKYLFFVAKGGGRHTFSETFDAHNNAIQKGRDDN